MKKRIVIFLFLLASLEYSFCQSEYPKMPVNPESKEIAFEEVVEVTGINKDELYNRALKWFNTFYVNPNGILTTKDPVKGELFGMPAFKINKTDEAGVKQKAGIVKYTIHVFLKDGKYKYNIKKIHWDKPSYWGIEQWLDEKSPYKNDYLQYLIQTDSYFKDLIAKMKQEMLKSTEKKSEEW